MQENDVNLQDNYFYMHENYVNMQVSNLFRDCDFYMDESLTKADI